MKYRSVFLVDSQFESNSFTAAGRSFYNEYNEESEPIIW